MPSWLPASVWKFAKRDGRPTTLRPWSRAPLAAHCAWSGAAPETMCVTVCKHIYDCRRALPVADIHAGSPSAGGRKVPHQPAQRHKLRAHKCLRNESPAARRQRRRSDHDTGLCPHGRADGAPHRTDRQGCPCTATGRSRLVYTCTQVTPFMLQDRQGFGAPTILVGYCIQHRAGHRRAPEHADELQ